MKTTEVCTGPQTYLTKVLPGKLLKIKLIPRPHPIPIHQNLRGIFFLSFPLIVDQAGNGLVSETPIMIKCLIVLQIKSLGESKLPAKGHAGLGLSCPTISSAQYGTSHLMNMCYGQAHTDKTFTFLIAIPRAKRPNGYSKKAIKFARKIPSRSQDPTSILFSAISSGPY